jgi:multiple sugar transport system permease protein
VALAHFHSIYFSDSTLIQAGNIMTLIIPVVLFFIFQRVFIRGIVITGIEK